MQDQETGTPEAPQQPEQPVQPEQPAEPMEVPSQEPGQEAPASNEPVSDGQ